MCGYEPFYWYDWQLDKECANDMGFDTLQELYEFMSKEKEVTNDRI